jgi:hypothetical protein
MPIMMMNPMILSSPSFSPTMPLFFQQCPRHIGHLIAEATFPFPAQTRHVTDKAMIEEVVCSVQRIQSLRRVLFDVSPTQQEMQQAFQIAAKPWMKSRMSNEVVMVVLTQRSTIAMTMASAGTLMMLFSARSLSRARLWS